MSKAILVDVARLDRSHLGREIEVVTTDGSVRSGLLVSVMHNMSEKDPSLGKWTTLWFDGHCYTAAAGTKAILS